VPQLPSLSGCRAPGYRQPMSAPDTGAGVGHPVGARVGRGPPGQTRLRQLAEEQAALRRMATLAARGARPAEVFSAIAGELGLLIGAEASFLACVDLSSGHRPGPAGGTAGEHGEPEGTLVVEASCGCARDEVPVGFRSPLLPGSVMVAALKTGRPARVSGDQLAKGPCGNLTGKLGLQAAVATPIVVEAGYWGVAVAATVRADFPTGTESRLADFTELAATVIASAQGEKKLRELARTQAALRRLATLVAHGEPPEAVFGATTREALRHFGGCTARLIRYESDGTVTLLANEGTTGPHVRVGERWEGYPPSGLTATVRRTGRAARVDDYRDISGGEPYVREGLRSAVATPVHVNGRLWGAIAVGSGQGPLPPDTGQRMTEFTDLVASAVVNAQNQAALEASRDELARLVKEQAALHRVATLVGRAVPPEQVFAAVTAEVGRLLSADVTLMSRYDQHDAATLVGVWTNTGADPAPIGARLSLGGHDVHTLVLQTGRPARIDDYSNASGMAADIARKADVRSAAGVPISVAGRLWGIVVIASEDQLPPDTEARLADFTELVGTAVGNAESRAELDASRTRIVAAADQARRRIERDLHDGIQQRLVSLSLELRVAQSEAPAWLPVVETQMGRVAGELNAIVEDLREIARGIHPAILSDGGLRPALRTLGRRAAVDIEVRVDVDPIPRLPEPIEVAAYYVVSEALTNATRHAQASVVWVAVKEQGGSLHLSIRDDGVGGADPARGSGLIGLRDRAEALGGSLEVNSPPGAGTQMVVQLPLRLR
jgi:signal transduction histidine kinase